MFSADLGGAPPAATPAATDPPFQKVALLLHGDGTNGAQNNTFVDSSTNNFTITRTGNVAQGTFSPFSLADGQWSNYFDGSSYFSITNIALTGDFTFEFWWYRTDTTTNLKILAGQSISSTGQWVSQAAIQFGSGTTTVAEFLDTVTINTWNHTAFVRRSGVVTIFLNGVQKSVARPNQSATLNIAYLGTGYATTYNWLGYISNIRIVNGTGIYTSNFTPSTIPLTAITNTSLLTCQSNRFKDNSSNNFTITRNGDTKVTAFSPFAPSAAYSASTNGGSGYFDGSGDYLSAGTQSALSVGANNWTLETWIYRTNASNFDGIFSQWVGGGQMAVRVNSSSRIETYFYTTTNLQLNATTTSVVANQWNHVALVRNGTTITLYVNGVADATTLNVGTAAITWYGGTVKETKIGYYIDNGSPLTGYLSNLRFVIGTAVYTSNFTPPTAPLTAVTNTQLLLNCTNAGIIDNAGKNDIETVGNAQISTSVKKYGTGSMYFDGSGDYLINQGNIDAFTFGTGDFTIEFWIYLNNVTQTSTIFDTRPLGTNGLYPVVYTSAGSFRYFISSSDRITSSTYSATTWYHVAVCRSGTATKMFVNGIQAGSTYTDTNNYICAASRPVIGINSTSLSTFPLDGYIDDLRITKGQALYTSNFTPPTQAFPNV